VVKALTTASGPECVKTLIASSSWIIDVRWLSDSKVNVAGRIGRDLEHVNAVFYSLWDEPKSAFFRPSALSSNRWHR
jgi:hypothetical protein